MTTETLAYETQEYRGYKIKAFYLNDDKHLARVELWKDGEIIRSLLTQAYRVWNYSAHIYDIVEELYVN
jgi:hypothetical protein